MASSWCRLLEPNLHLPYIWYILFSSGTPEGKPVVLPCIGVRKLYMSDELGSSQSNLYNRCRNRRGHHDPFFLCNSISSLRPSKGAWQC